MSQNTHQTQRTSQPVKPPAPVQTTPPVQPPAPVPNQPMPTPTFNPVRPTYDQATPGDWNYQMGNVPEAARWQGFNAQDFQNYKDPGYDYRLAQGQQALMRQQAAGSGAFGGAAGKALVRYGQQQGSNEFAAARNRAMQDYQIGVNRQQQDMDREQLMRRNSLEDYKIAEARAVQNRAFNMQDLAQENQARAAEFAQLSGMSSQGLNAVGMTTQAGNQAVQGQTQANMQGANAQGQGAIGAANASLQGYQMSYNAWRDSAMMSTTMSGALMGMAGTIIGAAIM